jgi:hypothetical protein
MNVFDQLQIDHFRDFNWDAYSEQSRAVCAAYSLAYCFISQSMGVEWAERHAAWNNRRTDYFKAKRDDQNELMRHMMRVIELGELIYHLHSVPGFNERIESIKSDGENGVESGVAELIAGKFLFLAGVSFRYITIVAKDGQNPPTPDIEYEAWPNRIEKCEVKCNLQSTEMNDRSITNILEKARKQLPSDKAGLILLRVPENWLADMEEGATLIWNAIGEFIRRKKSKRFSSIYLFASVTKVLGAKTIRAFPMKEFPNGHCEWHCGIHVPRMRQNMRNWIGMEEIVVRTPPHGD